MKSSLLCGNWHLPWPSNPNTIQRAYHELEDEGYIYTVPGKGCFVSEVKDAKKERRMDLFQIFDATVKELLFLATPVNDLQARNP